VEIKPMQTKRFTWKTPKGKTMVRKRGFIIMLMITMVFLWYARISELNWLSSHVRRDLLFTQVVSVG